MLKILLILISTFTICCGKENDLPKLNIEYIGQTIRNNLIYRDFKVTYPGPAVPSIGIITMTRMDGHVGNPMAVSIQKNGSLLANNEPITLSFSAGYTEQFYVMLYSVTADGKKTPIANSIITPFPLRVIDDKNRQVELVTLDAEGTMFIVSGKGFEPNTKIAHRSKSVDEEFPSEVPTDANGNFMIFYLPSVIGHTEGPFELTFMEPGKQPMTLKHFWGKLVFTNIGDYADLQEKYSK